MIKLLITLIAAVVASVEPHSIPRKVLGQFRKEGAFEGGRPIPAHLEKIRFAFHRSGGYERWVLEFSDENRKSSVAPKFLLRYLPPSSENRSPRFILSLRSIKQSFLKLDRIKRSLAKSQIIRDVIVYPPIEDGDMSLELILKEEVLFEPHQPLETQGKLVLDLKPLRLS